MFLKVEPLDLQEVEEGVGLEGDGLAGHVAPDPGGLQQQQQSVSQLGTIPPPWAWSGLSLRISPVYVGRDSSHSRRPLTPSFGYIISPKFLFSSG